MNDTIASVLKVILNHGFRSARVHTSGLSKDDKEKLIPIRRSWAPTPVEGHTKRFEITPIKKTSGDEDDTQRN